MKSILCFFVIALSVCVYPIFLRVPIEISHVFGLVEVDIFSWYRMWLVLSAGAFFFVCSKEEPPGVFIFYWVMLMLSTLLSKYYRTSLFGSPWNHEGMLAIIGYTGIYQISKERGLFKELEESFDVVIWVMFLVSILQIIYGNFLDFPPIKSFIPKGLVYEVVKWPLCSTLGSSNHLGLFCALFFPYTLLRRKYGLAVMVLFMAVCSQTRGAWLSIAVTTIFISRRLAVYVAILSAVLAAPFYKQILFRLNDTIHQIHIPLSDRDLDGRVYMWKRALSQMRHTIILGHGPGNFGLHFPQKEKRKDNMGFKGLVVDRPHNMYINIWTTTGLLSLIAIGSGVFVIILMARDPSLQLGAIGFLIAAFFTDSVLAVTPYFIIFLGALSHKKEWYEYNET